MTGAERREEITAEIVERTGITEAMIERLVRGFYAKVRTDAVLAPIFEARIRTGSRISQQMCAFWSSVALMTRPLSRHADGQAHAAAGRCRAFRPLARTVRGDRARNLSADAAEAHFVERARRIAASLELGVAGAQGVMLGTGERFRRRRRQEQSNERSNAMS